MTPKPPRPLTPAQAVDLANKAIDRWIQFLAIDANLYERYGRPFHGKGASERRKRLQEAKTVLTGMLTKLEEVKE